ncbi:MAG: hypothetical protein ACM336_13685 [Acidobacteriota bacterium]
MSTSTISEHAKLAELRAKTDRQLIRLVSNDLELGLKLAAGAEADRASAARACEEAGKLLPKVYSLSERVRLETKLGELRAALDRPCACTAGGPA